MKKALLFILLLSSLFASAQILSETTISSDVPIIISGSGTPTITSTLNIPTGGTISDVNITMNVTHTWISDLTATLISPSGTEVQLFAIPCEGGIQNINATFDDAGIVLVCGNYPGISGTVQPTSALSAFNGLSATGIWTLRISDSQDDDGGSLNSWSLNICVPCTTPTENTTTVTACPNYVWANNSQTYTESGTYTGTTTNCVTEKLVLTIDNTPAQTNFSSGGLNYVVTSATTVAVGNNSGASGPIIIPASVSNACFDYTVTSIGGGDTFGGCSGLTSVTIPNSVTSIADYAFYGCSGLTSVTIGNSVTSIGDHAFDGCSGLTSVTIPNSVTSIGDHAFQSCSGLTSVTIPNSVISISDYAFADCSDLTSVTIPNSVTSIGQFAFLNCTGLKSVTIPNSVTSIGFAVFANCSGLTSVTIPNLVTSIGDNAFNGCSSLTSVVCAIETPLSIDSSVFLGVNQSACTLVVPAASVAAYQAAAFWQDFAPITCGSFPGTTLTSNGLNYVVTSETTVAVGNNSGASGIINIPASVTNGCFDYTVTSIGDHAFDGCSGLTSVTIPNSVTSIGDYAFFSCAALTSVSIPNSVTSIGGYAFQSCTGLTSVTIPNSVTSIGKQAFAFCSGLTSGTIGNSVTSIGVSTFFKCSGLTSVTIPNSVTSIGKQAFAYCSGLTSVTIGNSVTSIDESTFFNCSGLTSVTIPNSVTSISEHAFNGCSGLTSVTIPNSVTSIGGYAFYGCSGLTSVTIGNSVTIISQSAFNNCSGLTSVTIPNSVTSISWGAFEGCYGLTSVTIPNSVTSIGDYAFKQCSGLTSVVCEMATPLSINPYVFEGVHQGACSLTVPNASVAAYQAAAVWQDFAPICTPTENTTTVTACPNYVWANNNQTYTESGTYTGTTTNCVTEKLVLTIITTPTDQTNFSSGGLNYVVTSATTVAVGDNRGTSGIISIPASVSNACFDYRVTSIVDYAFQESYLLTSVTIPNSVTSISDYAFNRCYRLTSVTIPNSVTSIGDSAFGLCYRLTSVTIPNSVTSIGFMAFANCSGLKSVIIPNSVTSIVRSAFSSCTGLTSVTIGNSLTSIGQGAFQYCSSLTSVTCEMVTPLSINPSVFQGVNQAACSLTVTDVAAYKAAAVWQNFAPITCATPTENTTTVTACGSYAWANNSQTYTESGTYTGTTTNCVTEKLVLTIMVTNNAVGAVSSDQLIFIGSKPANITLTGSEGTVQWQSSLNNSTFTDIVGATGTTLTGTQMGSLTTKRYYRAVVTSGSCASVTSGVVTVNVVAPTKVKTSQCGKTLALINSTISADVVVNANKYLFEISKDNAVIQELPGTISYIRLTSLTAGAQYGTTYSIRVKTSSDNGVTWSNYGTACSVTTPAPTTKVQASQCGKTLATIESTLSADVVLYANKYRFEISKDNVVVQELTSTTNYTRLTNLIAGAQYGTAYSIRVKTSCDNGLTWSDYGTACMVTTPAAPLTKVKATQCGKILASIESTLSADVVINANKYLFEISKDNAVIQELPGTISYIRLTSLTAGAQYGTTYSIRVKTSGDNGVTWSNYGAPCTVTTPAAPLTKIKATQCGTTLASITSTLSADVVLYANKYQFEISKDNSVVQELISSKYYILLTNLTAGAQYGTIYSIRVKTSCDNGLTWSDYGTACPVTTPAAPLTKVKATQCGKTLASIESTISADVVLYANKYRFEISKNDIVVQELTSSLVYMRLTSLTAGAQYGTTYSIRVKTSFDNGLTWSAYGSACTVITPSAPLTRPVDLETETELTTFKVTGYPNPYTETFQLDITTQSSATVEVMVYDMIGKLIEVRNSGVAELSTMEIGDRYATGVYNVIVTQGTEVKTVRMIKK